jgi:hypothetical protein
VKVQNLIMQQFFGENVISKCIWTRNIVDDIFNTMDESIELDLKDSINKKEIMVKKNIKILLLGAGEVGNNQKLTS